MEYSVAVVVNLFQDKSQRGIAEKHLETYVSQINATCGEWGPIMFLQARVV